MTQTQHSDHISLVTFGVTDLERSIRFYSDFGFKRVPFPSEEVAFFNLRNTTFGLYGRTALADEAGVADDGHGFRGTSLAINLEGEDAVRAVLDRAREIGGRITRPAGRMHWGGFSGYFADPDGHLWEVSHNPFVRLDDTGRMMFDAGAP